MTERERKGSGERKKKSNEDKWYQHMTSWAKRLTDEEREENFTRSYGRRPHTKRHNVGRNPKEGAKATPEDHSVSPFWRKDARLVKKVQQGRLPPTRSRRDHRTYFDGTIFGTNRDEW